MGARIRNLLLHLFLTGAIVINSQTQTRIHLVVVLQFGVKVVGLLLQLKNLVLLGSDVPFEVLDLVVQHKFEFLKFLGLLLQLVDLGLSVGNILVLLSNQLVFSLDLLAQFLAVLVLLVNLVILVLLLTIKLINLVLNIAKLVSCQLQLSLGFQRHILHLRLVVIILLADILNFKGSVFLNLVKNLLVFLLNLLDLPPHLVNLSVFNLDFLPVSLLLGQDLLMVLLLGLIKRILIHQTLFFLLHLKLVKPAGVLKHLLRVLIALGLNDFLLAVQQVLALVFVVVLSFALVLLKGQVFRLSVDFVRFEARLQRGYLVNLTL